MKKFVIVIPSYKNSKWYEKNISSVITQNYPKEHYRILYVDDLSPDDTGNLVEEYIKKYNISNIKLTKNTERVGAMKNLYDMIHSCDDEEIVVTLDGDDYLSNSSVLTKLNRIYSDPNIWMTYGSYMNSSDGSRGCCRPYEQKIIDSNSFRSAQWRASHLRTFYSWIFKKIKKEDFLDGQGKWLDMAWDLSFMLPLLEMTGNKHKYIHDILYVYNTDNPISDYKVNVKRQGMLDRFIRNKPKYNRI